MDVQSYRRLLSRFLTAKQAANRSPRTVSWYDEQITHFLLWIEDKDLEGDGVPALIDRFLAEERARGLSPSTVSARFRALSAWLNWCAKRKMIDVSPTAEMDRPRVPRTVAPYVTVEECNRLLADIAGSDWSDARDRLLILLLFFSGLRCGELVALNVDDIDRQAGTVRVLNGKGMKARVVPIGTLVPRALVEYLFSRPVYGGPELFVSNDGYGGVRGPLTTEGVRQMLIRRCRVAKLRYMHPHLWRHGAAMWLLNNGVTLSGVSALLGHSSTVVTETVYARWQPDALKREYSEALARVEGHNA
jgi:site-specific recombinase XerD